MKPTGRRYVYSVFINLFHVFIKYSEYINIRMRDMLHYNLYYYSLLYYYNIT